MQAMLTMIHNHVNDSFKLFNSFYYIETKAVFLPISKRKLPIVSIKKISELKSEELTLENNILKILLYCSSKEELNYPLDWFEKEDENDSLSYQFQTIREYYRRHHLIRKNSLKDPGPLYEMAIQKWRDPKSETNDLIANEVTNLDILSFAPAKGDSCAIAYERVLKSIHNKKDRHRAGLRKIYKLELEEALFKDVPMDDLFRISYLNKWKENLFGKSHKHSKVKKGRYEQSEAVDRYTAGKIILYLLNEFIASPQEKISGETACFLWILIRAAKEDAELKITLSEVVRLRISQVNKFKPEIDFGNERTLEISSGLHLLLLDLCGKFKKDIRLFENIDVDLKNLQRKFIKISKVLNIPLVMPSAFLLFPHLYPGIRIKAAEINARKKAIQLIPSSAAKTRKKLKDILKFWRECVKKTSYLPLDNL